MNVVIVRHGQVNYNFNKKYYKENQDLNDTGIKEANK